MKKHLVLLVTLFSLSSILAESSADKLISFHNITAKQKVEWNNFHKNKILQSKNLKNEIINDWVSLKNKNIKNLAKANLNEEFKETYFKQKLDAAVSLHKSHMDKWANLMKKENEAAYKLATKHYNELAKFENKDVKSFSKPLSYSYSLTKVENKSLKDKAKDFFSGKSTLPKGQQPVTDEEMKELDVDTPS